MRPWASVFRRTASVIRWPPTSTLREPAQHGPQLREVLDWILSSVAAEGRLKEVVAALIELQIARIPRDERELVETLAGEIGFPEVALGSRLPLALSTFWTERLTAACRMPVLVQFLLASGVLPTALPSLAPFNFEAGVAKVAERYVVVDRATLQAVQAQPEVLLLTPEEAEAMLMDAAQETGLQSRYEGLGRKFTPISLRFAFASRLIERGLDLLVVHNLVGNYSWATTDSYAAATPLVYQADYLKYHPLANV